MLAPFELGGGAIDPLTGNAERIRAINPHASLSQDVSYTPKTYDEAIKLIQQDLDAPQSNPVIDAHLDRYHDWYSSDSATARAAAEIVAVSHVRKRNMGMRMPTMLMNLWDRISFARVHRRNRLHANFNYHRHYHPVPENLDIILANIAVRRSMVSSETTDALPPRSGPTSAS